MIAEIIQRLATHADDLGLKLVDGAGAFQAAVESNPTATPAAYVVMLEENPAPSVSEALVIQEVSANIGVILVVRNVTDARGAAAQTDMETLRQAVKALLLGWAPAAGVCPLERGPGRLLAFRDGHMWWQDIYKTVFYDRSAL